MCALAALARSSRRAPALHRVDAVRTGRSRCCGSDTYARHRPLHAAPASPSTVRKAPGADSSAAHLPLTPIGVIRKRIVVDIDLSALVGATADQVAETLELIPLAAEGGMFRRLDAGPEDEHGRPAWSEIVLLLDEADFSALHRLSLPEQWVAEHGDPLSMLLLDPDGTSRTVLFGPDTSAGQVPTVTVPAGTWMGARLEPHSVRTGWALFRTLMRPGFAPSDFEGVSDAETLAADYPEVAASIRALCRKDAAVRMGGDGANPTEDR